MVEITLAGEALSFAVEKLGEVAIQKVSFLRGVKEEVLWLKDELEMMQCFLRDAARKQANDDRMRKWISDVREVAFDTEDAIDAFALKVDAPKKTRGLLGRCVGFPEHVYHLDKLGKEIESIKKRLKDIAAKRETYGIQSLDEGQARMVSSDINVMRRRRVSPWHGDNYDVGLEGHVETLLQKALLVEKPGLSIASIVGIGGVGKSTLAKKVYKNEAVGKRFERRAWVTVSQEFNPKELLKELVRQLRPRESELTGLQNSGFGSSIENLAFETKINKSSEEELGRMVQEELRGKPYLIVLDDVWHHQDWKYILKSLPVGDKTWALLITSRISHIISSSEGHEEKLDGLNSIESWQLFQMASKCPQELEKIGKMMVERCHGLPLAITVMAGLLLEKGESAMSEWEVMKSHLDDVRQDHVSAVLELSYWDLPPRLKYCFLCLSFFKEDAKIPVWKLIQLWISEGIIPQGKEKMTMEEIARRYLDELINRNMVQAIKLTVDGPVQYCQTHDFLWELSSKKAMEEINFHIIKNENTSNQSLDKSRHLSVHCSYEAFLSSSGMFPHVRSLFLHESASGNDGIPVCFWERFEGNVRVLELGGLGLTMLPKRIDRLVGLKYLGLACNNIKKLPRSLGHLNQLQTLDISGRENLYVPNVLWKLRSLRHLYMPMHIICKEPLKLDTLKNLQTLIEICNLNIVVEHLEKLVSLRELRLIVVTLDADVRKLFTLNWIVNLQDLTVLDIFGKVAGLPNSFPENLTSLKLSCTLLEEDPMPMLGRLPNLSRLQFLQQSYLGKEMVIVCNGFPRLKVLFLAQLPNLTQISIENGGLPQLKELVIVNFRVVNILPEEEQNRIKIYTSTDRSLGLWGKEKFEGLLAEFVQTLEEQWLPILKAPCKLLKDELHAILSLLKDADVERSDQLIYSITYMTYELSLAIELFSPKLDDIRSDRLLRRCTRFSSTEYDKYRLGQHIKYIREIAEGINANFNEARMVSRDNRVSNRSQAERHATET